MPPPASPRTVTVDVTGLCRAEPALASGGDASPRQVALWALLAYAAALRLVAPPVPVLGGLLGLPTMLGVLFLLLVVPSLLSASPSKPWTVGCVTAALLLTCSATPPTAEAAGGLGAALAGGLVGAEVALPAALGWGRATLVAALALALCAAGALTGPQPAAAAPSLLPAALAWVMAVLWAYETQRPGGGEVAPRPPVAVGRGGIEVEVEVEEGRPLMPASPALGGPAPSPSPPGYATLTLSLPDTVVAPRPSGSPPPPLPSPSPREPRSVPAPLRFKAGTVLLCHLELLAADLAGIQRQVEAFVAVVAKVAEDCEGFVHRTDAHSAVVSWNLLEDHPRHELAACRCALALEQALEERLRHACHVAVVASAGFAVGSVALPAQRVPVLSGRSYAMARNVLGMAAQLHSNIVVTEAVHEASKAITGFSFLDSLPGEGPTGPVNVYGRLSATPRFPTASPRTARGTHRTPRLWGPLDVGEMGPPRLPLKFRPPPPSSARRRCSVDSDASSQPDHLGTVGGPTPRLWAPLDLTEAVNPLPPGIPRLKLRSCAPAQPSHALALTARRRFSVDSVLTSQREVLPRKSSEPDLLRVDRSESPAPDCVTPTSSSRVLSDTVVFPSPPPQPRTPSPPLILCPYLRSASGAATPPLPSTPTPPRRSPGPTPRRRSSGSSVPSGPPAQFRPVCSEAEAGSLPPPLSLPLTPPPIPAIPKLSPGPTLSPRPVHSPRPGHTPRPAVSPRPQPAPPPLHSARNLRFADEPVVAEPPRNNGPSLHEASLEDDIATDLPPVPMPHTVPPRNSPLRHSSPALAHPPHIFHRPARGLSPPPPPPRVNPRVEVSPLPLKAVLASRQSFRLASVRGQPSFYRGKAPHVVFPDGSPRDIGSPVASFRREYTTFSDVGLISEDQLLVSARPAPCLIEEALSFTTRRKSGGAKQWYCSQTVIGSGGFGDVHLGMGERGTLVAIKRMEIAPEKTTQLMNEIKLLSELRHKHIVAYLGSAVVDHHVLVIMEYVCTSLAKVLANFGKLDLSSARPYTKDITEGLQFLHSQGVIHRDVKPQNVLMQQNGLCKLADFGTAALLQKTEAVGHTEVVGTPHYMAPEALWGYVGIEADVWALGVTLWEMLTGHLLIECTQQVAVLFRLGVMTDDPDIPTDLDNQASAFLKACLCFDRKNRLRTDQLLKMPFLLTRR